MNRWIEHFSDLYSTERPYTALVIDKVPSMEIMEEFDDEPQRWRQLSLVCQIAKPRCMESRRGWQKRVEEEEEEGQSSDGKTVSNEIWKGQVRTAKSGRPPQKTEGNGEH